MGFVATKRAQFKRCACTMTLHWNRHWQMAPLQIRYAPASGGVARRLRIVVTLPMTFPDATKKPAPAAMDDDCTPLVYECVGEALYSGWVHYAAGMHGVLAQGTVRPLRPLEKSKNDTAMQEVAFKWVERLVNVSREGGVV
eukprot:3430897-Prymnesium_polylepis.1